MLQNSQEKNILGASILLLKRDSDSCEKRLRTDFLQNTTGRLLLICCWILTNTEIKEIDGRKWMK